jgi:hypothetical protein
MYLWHDGSRDLLPFYEWLSLQDLVAEYRQIGSTLRSVGTLAAEAWPTHDLPLFRLDGAEYIALDCSSQDHAPLFHAVIEEGSRVPKYRGIGHLLAVTRTAYRTDAYRRRRGRADLHPPRELAAFAEHALPSELSAMEANWLDLERAIRSARGPYFQVCASTLAHIPDQRAVTPLMDRLDDGDPMVVATAAFALGTIRAESALADLTRLLDHPAAEVRNFAAHAMWQFDRIDSEATVDGLVSLLDDSSEMVVVSAVQALGTARSRVAVDPLLDLLRTSRPGIQQYVVATMAEIGDVSALPALRELRSQVASRDLTLPDRGGTRGSDPPPARLLANVDEAIKRLEGRARP